MNVNEFSVHECDVLVVGGGAAGSLAAIRAKEFNADVLLVDKSVFGRSGCASLASGAISIYLPGDDMDLHLKGRGDLVDQRVAERAVIESYGIYERLEEWGVPFVKENGKLWRGESPSGGLDAGLLGGGPAMMLAIRRKALNAGVRVINRVMITDILTSDGKHPTKGRAVGAIGVEVRTAKIHVFKAKSVIMCSGGFTIPYPKIGEPLNTMPIDLSGDGLAAELHAGAVMGNVAIGASRYHAAEFFTAPGLEHFSVQGARWVNRLGEYFMEKYKESEKAFTRRHTLGAAIELEVRAGRDPIFLDCRHFTPDQIRFLWDVIPIIMINYERAGYDLSKDLVPYIQTVAGIDGLVHAAGAVIDEKCQTSIPGLYAAGTCSDGANIKISLALPECALLGWWAGEHAAKHARENKSFEAIDQIQIEKLASGLLDHVTPRIENGISYEEAHKKLASVFMDLGTIVNTAKLQTALDKVQGFIKDDSQRIVAPDSHYLAKVIGLKNAATVSRLVLTHLLHRKESRGSIVNEDFPWIDNDSWLVWTRAKITGGGELDVWDEPIPSEAFVYRKPAKGKKMHPLLEVFMTETKGTIPRS